MDPEVSVVIPTKDHEPFLEDLMASLYGQVPKRPMEVLIVDALRTNGPVAEDWAALGDGVWEVRYIEQRKGRKGSAMNLGAQFARADTLLFLDSDVVLPPGAVHHALNLLRANDVVSALRRHEQLGVSVLSERIVRWWRFVTPWYCMMRRRTLEGLGGWTGNLEKPWDFEDVDLWIQTRRRGLRVGFIPERVVLKRRVRHELKKTWHFLALLFRSGGVFRRAA